MPEDFEGGNADLNTDINEGLVNSNTALDVLAPSETEKSTYLTPNFIFEPHVILKQDEVATVQDHLKDTFEKVLVEDRPNIFLLEAGDNGKEKGKNFLEGFQKYGSMQKAAAYASLQGDRPLSERNVSMGVRALDLELTSGFSDDPQAPYKWLVYKTIDEFIEKGYDIDVIFEDGLEEEDEAEIQTLTDFKDRVLKQDSEIKVRNQQIAQQIEDLDKQKQIEDQNANLIVLLGNHHYQIPELLPDDLKEVANIYVSPQPINPTKEKLAISKLLEGQTVSEDLWMGAFKEYKDRNSNRAHKAFRALLKKIKQ